MPSHAKICERVRSDALKSIDAVFINQRNMFCQKIIFCCYSWVCLTLLALAGFLHAWAEEIPSATNIQQTSDEIGQDENVKGIRQSENRSQDEAAPGKHVALLISVNEYYQVDGLPTLRYCDNDMDGLTTELEKFDYEIVRMSAQITDPSLQVNRTNVKEQLKKILDGLTGENDILFIAYSGHGIQEGKSRYLCPPNTPKNYDLGDLIPLYVAKEQQTERPFGVLNIIEDRFAEGHFKGTCFLFIDACRNGSNTNADTIFPAKGKFHIFSSCCPGEVSYEEDHFQKGRFMYYVIQAFNIADSDDLPYERLTGQVTRRMAGSDSKRIQTPTRHDTAYERSGSLLLGHRKKEDFLTVPLLSVNRLTPRDFSSSGGQPVSISRSVMQAGQWPDFSQKDQDEQNVVTDIIQLPGLNGEWWFQEMPWYVPHARLALTYVLSDYVAAKDMNWRSSREFFGKNIYAYLHTNTHETRELLWKYLNTDECKSILQDIGMDIDTISKLRKGISGKGNSRETQYDELKKILELLKKNRKNGFTCIDLYTFAVFEHQMALLSDNTTRVVDIERAKQHYVEALEHLATEIENPTALLFYQLCLADYSRLLAEMDGDLAVYRKTIKELIESLKQSYKNSLFQIAFFTELAYNESNFGRLREAGMSFREAELRIAESKIAKVGHPLVAHYNEQCGWYRVDYWRLTPAKDNFETALLLRRYNAWGSSDPIDLMYVTYGLHAMGTISRFSGNNEKAREYFEDAKESIKSIRNSIPNDGLSLTKNRLDEREASTLERLADLTLYDDTKSITQWEKALADYERGALLTNKITTTKTRLIAKRALLLLQKGKPGNLDNARKGLQEVAAVIKLSLDNPSSNTVIPHLFVQAASIAVELHEAVEMENEARFAEARTKMREFLERFHLFSRDPDGLKRDVMELRMLCAAMLIETDMSFKRNDLALADSTYLALCLYILSEKEGIHAYLRPHYERLLRLRTLPAEQEIQQENIRSIAMGIQRMRNISILGDTSVSTDRTILVHPSQTRGNTILSDEDSIGAEEPQSDIFENENKVFNPTRSPLVDTVTLVIFYFPVDPAQKGFVLIVPSGGHKMEHIALDLNREALHIKAQTGELKSSLSEVWKRIEKETERVSPLLFDEKSSMRQLVVISWSDESCWQKDSRERITKEMFPYKNSDLPVNVIVE